MYNIYKITNKINNKIYIGYSKRPIARWYDHKKYAERIKPGVLYDAMRKYGIPNFTFEVIYQSLDENYTKNVMEVFFINDYDSRVPRGYNVAAGGQGGSTRTGVKHTVETKNKISRAHKNKKLSHETKLKISASNKGPKNCMYGKHHSNETKRLLSEKAKGRHYDPKCRSYVTGPSNPTSKKYIIITPANDKIEITNLKHFCIQNGLLQGEMRRTLTGKARQHKGYRVVSVN